MQQTQAEQASLRVLAVDDDPLMTDYLAILLQSWGHEVHLAQSGQQALQISAEWELDVALVDLAMPRMDGFQLARRLHEQQTWRPPVLIALTGHNGESSRHCCSVAGFAHFLVKPLDVKVLNAILQSLAVEKVKRVL